MAESGVAREDLDVPTRLREVALELFGRRGVRDTSTREILAAAGLRNPSAISYHFGSKAALVDELIGELVRDTPVLRSQVELAAASPTPSVEAWTAIAVDTAARLIRTERGCLLARLWSEYTSSLEPDVFEEFLLGRGPLATDWIAAIAKTFPGLPQVVAIARNQAMLRSLEFMIARRAGRILEQRRILVPDPALHRQMMFEVALGMLSAPTTLTDADILSG